ncbi:MAG: aspartate kinase [Bacteroidetes bacterium]|nr:aspartate kinase [Bacteroidota bacterium]
MKIFKFGGASVKDANGVKNIAKILSDHSSEKLLVVISAMGKSTNHLERLVHASVHNTGETAVLLKELKDYHYSIIDGLDTSNPSAMLNDIENLFLELECLAETPSAPEEYDFVYDQVVSFGELISTKIVSHFLLSEGLKNQWIDSRNFIITDDRYRDARIQWNETEKIIIKKLKPLAERQTVITQGFIGRGPVNETTTLGREGSDYSAAIFAYCLNADSVTIWKDVAGVMNADPKKMDNATLIPHLGYSDAIELAYYGASVIHPKTIQPLMAKNIPLFVKSFVNPEVPGTQVSNNSTTLNVPCYIFKENQVLVELKTRDFTFIVEQNLEQIFRLLAQYKVRCNIIQNSAISFSFVADNKENKMTSLLSELEKLGLTIEITESLELITIYNATEVSKNVILGQKQVILEQNTGNTAHYLLKP